MVSEVSPGGFFREFFGRQFISRLNIVYGDVVREEVVIEGDGVIIHGGVFGKRVEIRLSGRVVINGDMGAYESLVVKGGEGGLVIVNGAIYPCRRAIIEDAIIMRGIACQNIEANRVVTIGPMFSYSIDGGEPTLKASRSLALTYISTGSLEINDAITLLPIIYGRNRVNAAGQITIAGENGVNEMRILQERISDSIRSIKSIKDPLRAIDELMKKVGPGYRDVDSIMATIRKTALTTIMGNDIRISSGGIPLFLAAFKYCERGAVEKTLDKLKKLLKDTILYNDIEYP